MLTTAFTSAFTALILSSSVSAAPAPAAAAAVTCQSKTLTFDELGNSNGYSRGLPNGGYQYNGLELRENYWGFVTKGLNYNGDFTADDRPVPQPVNQQQSNTTAHSGSNALMNVGDGFYAYIDSAHYSGGHRYYDLKSLWVAGEYPDAFTLKIECKSYNDKDSKTKTFSVPKLTNGAMYKVTLPSGWIHMWSCKIGATNLQQIQLDDWEYCLWDFPYATPIPW